MAATIRIPMVVTGGSGVVRTAAEAPSSDPDVRSDAQAENVDIAPTVSWLLGVDPPAAGFDGRVLSEAFTARPADSCTQAAGPEPVVPESPLPVLFPVVAAGGVAALLVLRRRARG